MAIDFKKSCCLRIGPRMNVPCSNICASSGIPIPWVSELRYLGINHQSIIYLTQALGP